MAKRGRDGQTGGRDARRNSNGHIAQASTIQKPIRAGLRRLKIACRSICCSRYSINGLAEANRLKNTKHAASGMIHPTSERMLSQSGIGPFIDSNALNKSPVS